MVRELSRRNLIRGQFTRAPRLPRPPYAIPERDFRTRCQRCDDCIKSCDTGIIGKDEDGFPVLRFGHAKCTFCGACADACKSGALNINAPRSWTISAHIDETCLSLVGTTCRACEESCGADAIRFRLMTGGRALALVDENRCTGCGNCAVVCPSHSIKMENSRVEEKVA